MPPAADRPAADAPLTSVHPRRTHDLTAATPIGRLAELDVHFDIAFEATHTAPMERLGLEEGVSFDRESGSGSRISRREP